MYVFLNSNMTDLTPLFNQCVDIIQAELKPPTPQPHQSNLQVHDTFNKESRQLYQQALELNSFLQQIKQLYLAINYDDPSSNGLSIDDKNKLDEDFQIKLQTLYEKLKILQNYENKRESISPLANKKKNWVQSLFGDDDEETYYMSLGHHRNQILRFLSDTLNNCSKNFQKLANQRHQREKQLNLLNFQNLEEDIDLDKPQPQFSDIETFEIDDKPQPQLDQQQIQEFEAENQTFLTRKTNQLKQVEKLHNSMVDIINIQTEITYQIENQSNQIMNLIDNQDQINLDLTAGNKKLTSATGKNKRSANIIVVTSIVLGLLILFMDYIS